MFNVLPRTEHILHCKYVCLIVLVYEHMLPQAEPMPSCMWVAVLVDVCGSNMAQQ